MPTVPDALLVSNDLAELARVAAWLDAWAGAHEVPASVGERLHLCCVEAVTNIIMHGYTDGGAHPICLGLRRESETVTLEIEDEGRAFDPLRRPDRHPVRDLEHARVGGWGIPIMRRFSDEIQYRRAGARNVLTFVFRLPAVGRIDSPRSQATE
jgi:serine/threonine-protein kinase RsbW